MLKYDAHGAEFIGIYLFARDIGVEKSGILTWLGLSQSGIAKVMLHLIWYIIIGFIAGCIAKAVLHVHLSIMWTIILGLVGSIIGGAVTHLFSPPGAGRRFHPAGIIVSILGAIVVLFLWQHYHLRIPRG